MFWHRDRELLKALRVGILAILDNQHKHKEILFQILRKEESIMATLDQIAADVTSEKTVIDSLAVLITGLKQQLDDVLAGVTLPPAVQAKVDEIFVAAEANKAALAAAVLAGTPAAPVA